MKFEHLVQINDPHNPFLEFMTRAQLWAGLWQRVENPVLFLPGLESCTITRRDDAGWVRLMNFGAAQIRDTVCFEHEAWVRFEIEAASTHPGGSLQITIEEPEPHCLFLRFCYETSLETDGENAAYSEYVKAAYQDSDIETVKVIRSLVTQLPRH